MNQKFRGEKNDEIDVGEQLLAKTRYELPGATESRVRAIVYRKL